MCYLENVIKEQGGVLALQELVIGKLSLRINAMQINNNTSNMMFEHLKDLPDQKEVELM